jgi:hypothetical protein
MMMTRAFILAIVVVGAIAFAAPQGASPEQQSALLKPGIAVILGRIVEAGTTAGVPGAIVTLTSPALGASTAMFANGVAGGPRRVMTDGQGQFVFRDLPAGPYVLSSMAAGYVDGAYGRTTLVRRALDLDRPLDLTDADKPLSVTIQMWKMGGISGRITDEAGEPMVGAPLTVMERFTDRGLPTSRSTRPATTDDRGFYHVDVAPGDYVVGLVAATTTMPAAAVDGFVQAQREGGATMQAYMKQVIAMGSLLPRGVGVRVGNFLVSQLGMQNTWVVPPFHMQDGHEVFYPTTFHPSSLTIAAASVVSVSSGEEKTGVDVNVHPVPARRVSGRVIGPDGPAAGIAVRVIAADADPGMAMFAIAAETSQTVADGAGDFTLLGIPPGTYTLKVLRASDPTEPVWWAAESITIGAETDLTNLTVRLQNGAPIGGRLVIEGSAAPPASAALKLISIRPTPLAGTVSAMMGMAGWIAHPDDNGRFVTGPMVPGPYMIVVTNLPAGWMLKSVSVGPQNGADKPFELTSDGATDVVVTITDKVSTLTGTARDANGQPEPVATVAVFPADRSLWAPPGMASRRIQTTAPGRDGRFAFRGLPAGDYLIVATDWPADFFDNKVLGALVGDAVRVTIAEGGTSSQDVRVVVKR